VASTIESHSLKKRISARLFPRYMHLLDLMNNNAKVASWVREKKRSVPRFQTGTALHDYIQSHYVKDDAITYLEFGVYEGASLKSWINRNKHPNSQFFGFDSFAGLPERWNSKLGKGAFDKKGEIPSIPDSRVTMVKGWFQSTLPHFLSGFNPSTRLIIHNDSDLYSSTLYMLTMMDRFIIRDTIIIFDEFSSPLHEFRAVHDYLDAYMRQARPIAMLEAYADKVALLFE
jgi:O-methyltransferase